MLVDPNGKYEFPAHLVRKFPQFANYLKNNVEKDVMSSPLILGAFLATLNNQSNQGSSNMNEQMVKSAVSWDSGPKIDVVDAPGGMEGANGYYDRFTNTIQLSTKIISELEMTLSSDVSNEEKLELLLPVFMLILHETAHYGDVLLDGVEQSGEPAIC